MKNAKDVVLRAIAELESSIKKLRDGTNKGKEYGSYNEKQETDSEIKMVEEIALSLEKFIENTQIILEVAEKPDEAKFYLALFVNTVEPLSRILQEQIDKFKIEEFNEVRQELESLEAHTQRTAKILSILSTITFSMSILIGVFLARNIASSKEESFTGAC